MVEAAAAQPAWVLLAYLIAGVCFILALRGLSSPESSRRGNRTGMIGMAIAVLTTLITHVPTINGIATGAPLPGQDEPYRKLSNRVFDRRIVRGCPVLRASRRVSIRRSRLTHFRHYVSRKDSGLLLIRK